MFHLEYYIVHEVIEKEWYYFLCSFDHSTSIDDVIKAHERMLTRIFMGTLMDTQYKVSSIMDRLLQNNFVPSNYNNYVNYKNIIFFICFSTYSQFWIFFINFLPRILHND